MATEAQNPYLMPFRISLKYMETSTNDRKKNIDINNTEYYMF